jgi:hypothetical protein
MHSYKPKEVLRVELNAPDAFTTHHLFINALEAIPSLKQPFRNLFLVSYESSGNKNGRLARASGSGRMRRRESSTPRAAWCIASSVGKRPSPHPSARVRMRGPELGASLPPRDSHDHSSGVEKQ